METSAYQNWLAERASHRSDFYGEEGERHHDAIPPLSELAIATHFRYRKRDDDINKEVLQGVRNIFAFHDNMTQETEGGLYSFCSQDAMYQVASLTASIVRLWERACERHDVSSPFSDMPIEAIVDEDFTLPSVQKVIEIGAVAMEIFQVNPKMGESRHVHYMHTPHFIARRSPDYTLRWLKKDVIREYCYENGIDCEAVLPHISRGLLERTAARSSAHPETRLAQRIKWFAELTPARIAREVGWSEEDVEELFSPSRVMYLCEIRGKNPIDRIKEMVNIVETQLAPSALADHLGWNIRRVESVFTRKFVMQVVVSGNSSLKNIARIARLLDTDLSIAGIAERFDIFGSEVAAIFPGTTLRDIAFAYRSPNKKIQQVVHDFRDVYSVERIADALDIPPDQASRIFKTRIRADFAIKYKVDDSRDRYARARELFKTIGHLETEYGIHGNIAMYLARASSTKNAFKKAAIINDAMRDKPSGISEQLWMRTVAIVPYGTHQQRLEFTELAQQFFGIDNPFLVDTKEQAWRLNDASLSYSILPQVAETEPSPKLRELGQSAGIGNDDLQQLLYFFADSDECALEHDEIESLLTKLRTA